MIGGGRVGFPQGGCGWQIVAGSTSTASPRAFRPFWSFPADRGRATSSAPMSSKAAYTTEGPRPVLRRSPAVNPNWHPLAFLTAKPWGIPAKMAVRKKLATGGANLVPRAHGFSVFVKLSGIGLTPTARGIPRGYTRPSHWSDLQPMPPPPMLRKRKHIRWQIAQTIDSSRFKSCTTSWEGERGLGSGIGPQPMRSLPTNGCSTSGTRTVPSACW